MKRKRNDLTKDFAEIIPATIMTGVVGSFNIPYGSYIQTGMATRILKKSFKLK